MKRDRLRYRALAGILALVVSGHAAADNVIITGVGFAQPVAARFDPSHNRYLVSNMNGAPTAKHDSGFISAVNPDGSMAALKWIAGGKNGVELNVPKGFVITADALYVADIDTIRVFDLKTGRSRQTMKVKGARNLQDVAIAEDGTIYACDAGTNLKDGAVFKIVKGKATLLAEGVQLFRPNAIALLADGNLIITPGIGTTLLHMSPVDGKLVDLTGYPTMMMPFEPRSARTAFRRGRIE